MNNISIKKNFLAFILINIFLVSFYLFTKHSIGNDSSISEWLINYQGGFTRRGLGGEVVIFFSRLFEIFDKASEVHFGSVSLLFKEFSIGNRGSKS